LPWLLPVGAPNGAEGAVLGTAANGLDGRPHVAVAGQQVPARRLELLGSDPAALIHALRGAAAEIGERAAPGHVTISAYHRAGRAILERLFGIQRGVDAAKNDVRSTFAGEPASGAAAQC